MNVGNALQLIKIVLLTFLFNFKLINVYLKTVSIGCTILTMVFRFTLSKVVFSVFSFTKYLYLFTGET